MPRRMRRPALLILLAVVVAVVAPVAWYLGSPLVVNQVVDEAFPVAGVAAPVGPTGTVAPVSGPPATPTVAAQPATATPPLVPTATLARPTTTAGVAAATPAAATPAAATPAPPTRAPVPTAAPPTATPAPAAPGVLRQGRFTRIDTVHWAEGNAVIYRLPDGQRVLRLEDFRAGNGPGLFVYLSGHPMPRSSQQVHDGGAVELAPLKGNIGNQNYVLPAGLDLAAYRSVVIFCKPFTVVFSTAELG